MYITSFARTSAMTVLLIVLVIFSYGITVHAQSDCPAGTQPATAGDLATMRLAGISNPQLGQCWDPNNANIGTAPAQWKDFLVSKLVRNAAARGEVSVTKMMPVFACRLANLIKAANQNGYQITIFSGWRDEAAQARAVAYSRPGYACIHGSSCPHVAGRAADLLFNGAELKTNEACNANIVCNWAHQNAASFQLVFPLTGNPLEPWHVEPVERAQVSSNGSCAGSTAPPATNQPQVAGGQQPAPNNQPTPQQIASMSTGQTYNQDTICVLSIDPPSSITIPAGTPYPSSCLNGNAPSSVPQGQQQSSAAGTQVASNQATPSSIPGSVSSSQVFPTAAPTPLRSTIQSPTLVTNLLTPSSTAALLAALANPQYSTTSTTTTVAVMLNPSLATNVSQLQPSNIPGVTYAQLPTNPSLQTPSTSPAYRTTGTGIILGTQPAVGSDTFISSDLNTSGGQDSFSQAPQVVSSNAASILKSLKIQLLAALSFLSTYTQPFQGNIPSQQEVD